MGAVPSGSPRGVGGEALYRWDVRWQLVDGLGVGVYDVDIAAEGGDGEVVAVGGPRPSAELCHRANAIEPTAAHHPTAIKQLTLLVRFHLRAEDRRARPVPPPIEFL